jgi:hypothetical protein
MGVAAMVVDLGYGMVQQGVVQNAADAGALAAGRLMAGSVALDASQKPVYALSDNLIHQQAADLADDNFVGAVADNHRSLAVQYLQCDGSPAGTRSFTHNSDPDLVVALVGSDKRMLAAPALQVPLGNDSSAPICMVRVYAQESHPPFFARILGQTANEQERAQATVRISPTAPPTVFTNLWPITHREDGNDKPCAFTLDATCPTAFWGKQGDIGSFKEAVDMSRLSAIGSKPEQLFAPNLVGWPRRDQDCKAASLESLFHLKPCYDETHPGTNTKDDAYFWATNGFGGQIYVPVDGDAKDPRCADYAQAAPNCPNARLETNINGIGAGPMRTALLNAINTGPIDPTCNCPGVTRAVLFWKYGEKVDSSTNLGTSWDDIGHPSDKSGGLNRVIIDKVRNFRFNTSTVGSNYITGYFVSFYTNNPPQGGPPSSTANTVSLVS